MLEEFHFCEFICQLLRLALVALIFWGWGGGDFESWLTSGNGARLDIQTEIAVLFSYTVIA